MSLIAERMTAVEAAVLNAEQAKVVIAAYDAEIITGDDMRALLRELAPYLRTVN